jgi:hypothetical protein
MNGVECSGDQVPRLVTKCSSTLALLSDKGNGYIFLLFNVLTLLFLTVF